MVRIAAPVEVMLGEWNRLIARDRMTLRRELWAARPVQNKLIHLPVSWQKTADVCLVKTNHTDTHTY